MEPSPPRALPPQVTTDVTGGWTPVVARIALRALVRQRGGDVQGAYEALVAAGCPEEVAWGAVRGRGCGD